MPLLSASTSDDLLLLCAEDSAALADPPPPNAFPDPTDYDDEAVAVEISLGGNFTSSSDYPLPSVDDVTRRQYVDWILKVCSYFSFQPQTAYLAVSYLNRFLSCHSLPQQGEGWPMQLLSVACLSLAAKMEETQVPALLELQVEDARFVFEPQTVCRMEVYVLAALDWRLRSSTPFSFLNLFARKADPKSMVKSLTARASMVILEFIREAVALEYHPTTIAAAALIYACDGVPNLAHIGPEIAGSWCPGLDRDEIENCYISVCESTLNGDRQGTKRTIQRSVRVTTTATMGNGISHSSPSKKRRKLNNCLWVEDDDKDEPNHNNNLLHKPIG